MIKKILFLLFCSYLLQDNLLIKLKDKTLNSIIGSLTKKFISPTKILVKDWEFEKSFGWIKILGSLTNLKIPSLKNINIKYQNNNIEIKIEEMDIIFDYKLKFILNYFGFLKISTKNIFIKLDLNKDLKSNIMVNFNNFSYEQFKLNIGSNHFEKLLNFFANLLLKHYIVKFILKKIVSYKWIYELKNINLIQLGLIKYFLNLGNYFEIDANNYLLLSFNIEFYNILQKKNINYENFEKLDINLIKNNDYNGIFLGNKILSEVVNIILNRLINSFQTEKKNLLNIFPNINTIIKENEVTFKYQIIPSIKSINSTKTSINYMKFLYLEKNKISIKNKISLKVLDKKGIILNYDYCNLFVTNFLSLNLNLNGKMIEYNNFNLEKNVKIAIEKDENCKLNLNQKLFLFSLENYMKTIKGEMNYSDILKKFGIGIDIRKLILLKDNLYLFFI